MLTPAPRIHPGSVLRPREAIAASVARAPPYPTRHKCPSFTASQPYTPPITPRHSSRRPPVQSQTFNNTQTATSSKVSSESDNLCAASSAPLEVEASPANSRGSITGDNASKENPKPQPADRIRFATTLVEAASKLLAEIWNPRPDVIRSWTFLASTDAQTSVDARTQPETAKAVAFPPTPESLPSTSPTTSPLSASATFVCPEITEHAKKSAAVADQLRSFVHEVLRRSRTSCSTLQTAMCYLEAARASVHDALRAEKSRKLRGEVSGIPVPQAVSIARSCESYESAYGLLSPSSDKEVVYYTPTTESLINPSDGLPSPLLCPRRTFLAALLLSSKFLQDRAYSNKAWAKLSGLEPKEVGRCERALGQALEWRLWVGRDIPGPLKQELRPSKTEADLGRLREREVPGHKVHRSASLPAELYTTPRSIAELSPAVSITSSDSTSPPMPRTPTNLEQELQPVPAAKQVLPGATYTYPPESYEGSCAEVWREHVPSERGHFLPPSPEPDDHHHVYLSSIHSDGPRTLTLSSSPDWYPCAIKAGTSQGDQRSSTMPNIVSSFTRGPTTPSGFLSHSMSFFHSVSLPLDTGTEETACGIEDITEIVGRA